MEVISKMSIEELEVFLIKNESEVIELHQQIIDLMMEKRKLESDMRLLKENLNRLEAVKIEEKASVSVWKVLAAACAAFGALLMSIFDRNEK